MTTVAADPDGVYEHGKAFLEHGANLYNLVNGFRMQLAGQGEVWGTDVYGVQFAGNYVPGTDVVLQTTHSLSEVVGSVGQNLQDTANAYRTAEIDAGT